jgi:RND superfamily putative drug exporter
MAIIGAKIWSHPTWYGKYVPDPDIEGERLDQRLPAVQPHKQHVTV